MIAILDYGNGNVGSVQNALSRIGAESTITKNIENADGIIIPGVGALAPAMANLKDTGAIEFLKTTNKPILGICLGFQMFFERGTEGGETECLGFFKGYVDLIAGSNLKLPHMGWNNLINRGDDVYFVHSYMAYTDEICDDYTEYSNIKIPAFIKRNNIWGAQFHPEKSGKVGEEVLKEWLQSSQQ